MSKKSNKVSKRELRRQQVQQEKRMRLLRIGIPTAVIALALVGLLVWRALQPEVEGAVFVTAAIPNQHDNDLRYEFGGLPPTGGVHNSAWQNCGIYREPVRPEHAIHSMEHGAVWITYHPDLPVDQVAVLEDVARGQGGHLLLSPYPDQSADIVLTAWDVQLQLEDASDSRVREFINRYRHTRAPERGASCSGGVGSPVG